MTHRAAFIVNARNKAALVGRAVKGALSQTYPCDIIISDQYSTDGTFGAIEKAIAGTKPAHENHSVRALHCPIPGDYGMRACNQHIDWLIRQTDAQWVFQCSADDYSLPGRVAACMSKVDELERSGRSCTGIATTMAFENPENPQEQAISGYPRESGYVSAGIGLMKMAYGSTIWGYRRDWLLKIGLDVPCTLDVYLGYLSALDRGYYVIAEPLHVHYMAAELDNMGFQGKMRAAAKMGDMGEIHKLNELNRFQLLELYLYTKWAQQQHYPLAHIDDQNALVNMIIEQAQGWYGERKRLHEEKIAPGIM